MDETTRPARGLLRALAATTVAVATTVLLAPAATAVQPDGAWNDPYIKAPTALVAAPIDSCRHQISFQRDQVDSRYSLGFAAEFRQPDGAVVERTVQRRSGTTLAYPEDSITSGSRYRLGNGYALAPFQVDVCSVRAQGEELVGFRLKAQLAGAYDYRNDYRSPRIVPVATVGAVPTAPQIIATVRQAGSDRLAVNWTAASGEDPTYRVLVRKPVYYGGEISWGWSIATTDVTTTSATVTLGTYRPELERTVAVVALGGNGFASDTAAVGQIAVTP